MSEDAKIVRLDEFRAKKRSEHPSEYGLQAIIENGLDTTNMIIPWRDDEGQEDTPELPV